MFARFVTVLLVAFMTSVIPHKAHALVGNLDDTGKFPYVVLVGGKNDSGRFSCSGVVISPKVVLTAAHCVWANGTFNSDMTVSYTDENGVFKTAKIRSKNIWEKYAIEMQRGGTVLLPNGSVLTSASTDPLVAASPFDIAVMVPESKILLPEYAEVDLYSRHWLKNTRALTAVGLGIFKCESYDPTFECEFDASRRYGDVKVSNISPNGGAPYQTGRGGNAGRFNPVMQGDSGGGLFVSVNGKPTLIGIISATSTFEAYYAPLREMRSFLKPFLPKK